MCVAHWIVRDGWIESRAKFCPGSVDEALVTRFRSEKGPWQEVVEASNGDSAAAAVLAAVLAVRVVLATASAHGARGTGAGDRLKGVREWCGSGDEGMVLSNGTATVPVAAISSVAVGSDMLRGPGQR